MRFAGNFPKENITYDNSVSDALKVVVLAVVPGTDLPLRDGEGKAVTTFKATEGLIHGAISSFRGGIFNTDHESIPETMIGVYDSVIYDNGFKVSGSVLCPIWKEKIMSGNYSGISIEGDITGEMINPDSMKINAISFLSTEKSPQGGACPLTNSEGNPVCKVEVIQDNKSGSKFLESQKIEAAWAPNYDAFWSYIETDGKINQSKAKKIFLKKTGDGSNRTDWHYPICHMTSEGNPEPDSEGLMAAYKRAAQQGETSLFSKIRSKMRSIDMEIPEGLKASKEKLEASFDQDTQTFSAKIVDEDNEILSEKQIIVINDNSVKGDLEMPKKELKAEIVTEVDAKIEASSAEIKVEPSEVKVEAEAEMKAALPDIPAMEVPEAKAVAPVAAPVVEPTLDWGLVKNTLGISSVDEFTLIKDAAGKIPSLEEKIDGILKENESLKSFKIETEKKWLSETYPQGVVSDIAAAHAEFTRDPAAFVQKYAEDSFKFKAMANVKLQGSAAESEITEEAKKMQARKAKRDGFLSATGGPVVR